MKKQFIAIVLMVAMLVAMVPAFAVPAAAETTHNIAFAPAEITVDGSLDDIYTTLSSETITSAYRTGRMPADNKNLNEALGFEGYAFANNEGVFVWMEIYGDETLFNTEETTLTNNAECLQIYYNMGSNSNDGSYRNGVFFDYAGNVSYKGSTVEGVVAAAEVTDGGWVGEVFIPWESGSPAAKAIANGEYDFFFAIGVRYTDNYNDDKYYNCVVADDEVKDYGSNYPKLPVVEFETFNADFEEDDEGGVVIDPDMRVAPFIDSDLTIDGTRDFMYAKGTKIVNVNSYGSSTKKGVGEMFEAYIVTTKTGFYIWTKMMDSTHINLVKDGCKGDYLQIYYNMGTSSSDTSTYGYVQFDYNNQFKFANYGTTGGGLAAADIKLRTIKNNDSWIAEAFIPWRNNSAIKNAVLAGSTDFFFAVGLQYNDDDTDDGNANRNNYYYDDENGISYWNHYEYCVPYQAVYFDGTPDIPVAEKVNFSNVLTVGPKIQNPVMKYTVIDVNGDPIRSTEVNGVLVSENKYKFSFDIAPQYMSCKIKAELMYSGVALATVTEDTSIRDYCANLVNMDYEGSGLSENQFYAMKYLIYNMLNYGAAAQSYTGFDTDNLVNRGFEDKAFNFEEFDYQEIKKTEPVKSYNSEFVSMGVYFDSANHLFVKFTTEDDINNYKVTFSDGKPGLAQNLTIYEVQGKPNTYIAYSPAISPENYHYQYVFRLVNTAGWNNVVVQTAYCNVNAYLAEMIATSDNPAMVELAKATYLYAAGVRAYLAS